MIHIIHFIGWLIMFFLIFMAGWATGYQEGREDQREIIVRLRKQIASR